MVAEDKLKEFIDRLSSIIERQYNHLIAYVHLFGSVIEDRSTIESDIDVAVRFFNNVSQETRYQVFKELLSIIDENIDLVDLSRASTVLRMEVYNRGKLVYCKDKDLLYMDQIYTLKAYDDYLHVSRRFREKMVRYIERMLSKKI